MSFWDNVKKFTQPYSDDDYDEDYDDVEGFDEDVQESTPRARRTSPFANTIAEDVTASAPAAPATSSSFNGQVLNMNSGKQEVVLFHAKTFDDAAKAADELRKKKAVILNMENVQAEVASY